MLERESDALPGIAEQVARELTRVEHGTGRSLIKTALLYPSGTTIVLSVAPGFNGYVISDMGMGYAEAEQIASGPTFVRQATAAAEEAGIAFENHAFIVRDINRDQLVGAAMTVANTSMAASVLTAQRAGERQSAESEQRLIIRLVRIFGPVDVKVEVPGSSQTRWRFDAMVRRSGVISLFDSVSSHHVSISSAVTKFLDISRLEDAPRRFAVTHSKKQLGTALGVLSQVSNVIEDRTPDEVIARWAA